MCTTQSVTLVCSLVSSFSISDEEKIYTSGRLIRQHQKLTTLNSLLNPELINIKSIACGEKFIVCLDYSGNAFALGSNQYGQLGEDEGKLEFSDSPIKLNVPPVKQISAGASITICISETGHCYTFGQLDSKQNYQETIDLQDIDFVQCGRKFVFFKLQNNKVYCWGENNVGQLGIGNIVSQLIPFHCNDWPYNVIDIKCGANHTLVLTSNGDVYSCGDNSRGQIGYFCLNREAYRYLQKIEDLSGVTIIGCGLTHSMVVDGFGDFYGFGDNSFGQLGLGDTVKRYKPIKHPSLSNIIDISNGGLSTFVKTISNEIYAFGYNSFSQLGIEIKTNEKLKKQLTPIRVFEDNENIWCSKISKSKVKSARSIR